MKEILNQLRGGDRRSIGKANVVAQEVANNPENFGAVFNGLYDHDPIVRMRAADCIEKVTRNMPELLDGYNARVIALLETTDQQEVCWHLAQIAPRLDLTKNEQKQVIVLLKKLMAHKSKIVQVSAMDALVSFSERDKSLVREITEIIRAQMKDGSPAVLSRGKKLLVQLERINQNGKA